MKYENRERVIKILKEIEIQNEILSAINEKPETVEFRCSSGKRYIFQGNNNFSYVECLIVIKNNCNKYIEALKKG